MKKKKAVNKLESFLKKGVLEVGCDEAGRGCLAGPVYAAAVILPEDFTSDLLNDSKKLTEKHRYELRPLIEEKALAWGVGVVDHIEIDKINILNASILAMHRAIENMKISPEHIIVDGNKFKPYKDIPHQCVVKGDGKYLSIAAASVLAKTYRDDFMMKIHKEFPQYGWDRSKGYPTLFHREAVIVLGHTPYHRKSYHLKSDQLTLKFDIKKADQLDQL